MVTDQLHTLVYSEKEIQPFIQNLTGINKGMLENAPKFSSISQKINEITKNCIIVAHNADFDYRILKNTFNIHKELCRGIQKYDYDDREFNAPYNIKYHKAVIY